MTGPVGELKQWLHGGTSLRGANLFIKPDLLANLLRALDMFEKRATTFPFPTDSQVSGGLC